MSDNWDRVRGDVRDTLVAKMNGVASLVGITSISADVVKDGVSSSLTVTVLDAAACTVTVSLSPWLETATPGVWYLRIHVTFPSGPTTVSWPAKGRATITVDET